MRIALVTDAWFPQINGVVRTLSWVKSELEAQGYDIEVIAPDHFKTLPCPTYPEIRLAIRPGKRLARMLDAIQPVTIHIATEGPLGFAARRYCLKNGYAFTTSYHTRFPEYINARLPVPLSLGYAFMRWFHGPSSGVMVATETVRGELTQRGFKNLQDWSRGVDTALFRPDKNKDLYDLPRPIFLNVGRVSVEKNIKAFLDLDLPGSKVVVGGGPQLEQLRREYPGVHFTGAKQGEDLARHYAAGDVFVFPSRTDTFGLVLLEALASGLPVAAFPVPGPLDVIGGSQVGVLGEDLGAAALKALDIPPEACRDYALGFTWAACAQQFLGNLRPFR